MSTTQILADDTVVSDSQSSCPAQISKLAYTHIIPYRDAMAGILQSSGNNHTAEITYAHIITQDQSVFSQSAEGHMFSSFEKSAPLYSMAVQEGDT